MMNSQKSVLIVGSINVDCTVNVDQLPRPGETIHGSNPIYLPGGKGGNQAVAVAAAGSNAIMIGAVGEDIHGSQAIESLEGYGVQTDAVLRKTGTTGTAFIFVESTGENLIVVTPGANSLVEESDVESSISKAANGLAPLVLAQMELPLETVEHAAKITEDLGGRFILNLAPAAKISEEILALCDPLVLNESEAAFLLGRPVETTEQAAEAAFEISKMAKSVVITLGSKGAVYATETADSQVDCVQVDARKVQAVDTTGAGDAFLGAMAAALSKGEDIGDAVHSGIEAGTNAVLHFGAQPPRS